ncbi:DNA replication protein [Martiniozyma asiatica (nom. inval.)]|nr:DNA replication protein [Martiniozyma asiatica]
MYGDLALRLAQSGKRNQQQKMIGEYEHALVDGVIDECNEIEKSLERGHAQLDMEQLRHSTTDPFKKVLLEETQVQESLQQLDRYVKRVSQERNKRILLAYEWQRAESIREFAWCSNGGGGTSGDDNGDGITQLTGAEQRYSVKYNALIEAVKAVWSNVDLNGKLTNNPPGEIFQSVRVLNPVELVGEYGTLALAADSETVLRASDVERLSSSGHVYSL